MSSRLFSGGGSHTGGDSANRIAAGFILIGLSILGSLKASDVLCPRRRASSASRRTSKHDEVLAGSAIHSASCPVPEAKYRVFNQIGTLSVGRSDSVIGVDDSELVFNHRW